MRVLVVDDNLHLSDTLRRGLKPLYAVDVVHAGREAIAQTEHTPYDIILLDLNLPDVPGGDVCAALRFNGVKAPILILSGRDVVRDKIALLDMGADDYITKPFSLEEVKARMRTALRHAAGKASVNVLRCGDIALDPASRTVFRGKTAVMLRRKEFDLLEYFMRNHGRTLTRRMILEHIWDMKGDNLWANVVDVHIKHLRDGLDRPFGSRLIKTVHGVGYKLVT